MAKSLLPLGRVWCVGQAARPLFARPAVIPFQIFGGLSFFLFF